MGIASPPAAVRNVTVENFLPQQGWGKVEEFKFPEGKIHYRTNRKKTLSSTPVCLPSFQYKVSKAQKTKKILHPFRFFSLSYFHNKVSKAQRAPNSLALRPGRPENLS